MYKTLLLLSNAEGKENTDVVSEWVSVLRNILSEALLR